MAKINSETFIMTRQDLRKMLIAFGINERNLESILSTMEKSHRHISAVSFAGLLEKAGLDYGKIANILRRLGLDDITVRSVLEMADEQKIVSETGRLFDATLEFQ